VASSRVVSRSSGTGPRSEGTVRGLGRYALAFPVGTWVFHRALLLLMPECRVSPRHAGNKARSAAGQRSAIPRVCALVIPARGQSSARLSHEVRTSIVSGPTRGRACPFSCRGEDRKTAGSIGRSYELCMNVDPAGDPVQNKGLTCTGQPAGWP
jgi:hypothetical protein